MKKLCLILVALTIIPQPTWAILDEHKIDIREAIEKVLQTNPQIQMLDMDIEISKNNTKAANRLENPSIDVFQSMGKSIKTEPQLIGGTYKLEILKRGKRKQQAKSQELVAQNTRQFSQYGLILEVRKAYIDLLLKKSILNIRKQQEKLAKELYDSMQKDVKAGKRNKRYRYL